MTRTSDDGKKFNTKYRLMLEVSAEMRQQCLADFPEVLFEAVEGSSSFEQRTELVESLQNCQEQLSHQLIHR